MDGVPVFNLVRETMPAVTIDGFRGVINTTCQLHPVGARARHRRSTPRSREMQARGIAEADPSLDIDGWDAAAKTAALVNVLMGGGITPHHVPAPASATVRREMCTDAVRRGRASGWSRPLRGVGPARRARRAGAARSPAIRSRRSDRRRTRCIFTPICSAKSASCSDRAR